jgi:hypothetical protein
MKTYKNTRNGKVFDLVPNAKGGFYWHERNYQGLFLFGATSDFNQSHFEYDIKHGILVEVLSCTKE